MNRMNLFPHGKRQAESEDKVSIIAEILRQTFNQSGAKIKDQEVIVAAARRIVKSAEVKVTLRK